MAELDGQAGGGGWSDDALQAFERAHPQGLAVQQIVDAFAAQGAPLTEATFRKYVQLGLLPRSVRVGRKGKHRGSQGLYPATVVRRIDAIRRLMSQGGSCWRAAASSPTGWWSRPGRSTSSGSH